MSTLISMLARTTAALLATGALVAAGVQSAAAAPTEVQPVASSGVSLSATINGSNIDYAVTNVPNRLLLLPGECTTVIVDAVAGAAVAGPAIIDTLSAGSPDVLRLIEDLIAADAVPALPQVVIASGGTVTGSFTNIASGVYALVTNCTIDPLVGFDPERFDFAGVLVLGGGQGSSTGSLGGVFGS